MAVTALGRGGELVDVKVTDVTVGGLDDPSAVRLGVVGVARAQSEPLSHLSCVSAPKKYRPATRGGSVYAMSCTHTARTLVRQQKDLPWYTATNVSVGENHSEALDTEGAFLAVTCMHIVLNI